MHVISSKVKEIDKSLTNLNINRISYVSFKHSSVEFRMVAIHKNEIINVKARYEILHNIKKTQKVKRNRKQYKMDELLRSIKEKNTPLFLAVE